MIRLCDTCAQKEFCPYRKEVMSKASEYWYNNEVYFCVTDCKHYKEVKK